MIKRLCSLLLMVLVAGCLSAQVTAHLTFMNVPITGSYQTVSKELTSKGFKADDSGFLIGKFADSDCGLLVKTNDSNGRVGSVVAYVYADSEASMVKKTNAIVGYCQQHYSITQHIARRFVHDVSYGQDEVLEEHFFSVPSGDILVRAGYDPDDGCVVTAQFRDHDGEYPDGRSDFWDKPTWYDITATVPGVESCQMGVLDYELVFKVRYQGKEAEIRSEQGDCAGLLKILNGCQDVSLKRSILGCYVLSVLPRNPDGKTVYVYRQHLNTVCEAFANYARQQKARQWSPKNVLFGMLRDHIFTKGEQQLFDKYLSGDLQQALMGAAFGGIFGSGGTNWDMLNDAQKAYIHSSSR